MTVSPKLFPTVRMLSVQEGDTEARKHGLQYAEHLTRELEKGLPIQAEALRILHNMAVLVYASGCGIGTQTMREYEALRDRIAKENKS